MTARQAASGIALLLLLAALVAGCGGSSGTTGSTANGGTVGQAGSGATGGAGSGSRAFVAPANAVCRQMLRQARKLGGQFIARVNNSSNPDLLAAAPKLLFKPGVAEIEASAARMRAIAARSPDPSFLVYVDLYEPLTQLAQLMLGAAEESDVAETHNLQSQMEGIGAEQRTAAGLAGLDDCRINFLHALVDSWSRP